MILIHLAETSHFRPASGTMQNRRDVKPFAFNDPMAFHGINLSVRPTMSSSLRKPSFWP